MHLFENLLLHLYYHKAIPVTEHRVPEAAIGRTSLYYAGFNWELSP